MNFQFIHSGYDFTPALERGDIHMVGFAEAGMSCWRAFLEFAFHYPLQEAITICRTINDKDETGTIYPKGNLTGLPVRFFRDDLDSSNIDRFRECLRDAFIANRDYCKSKEMVFHYGCAISNRNLIIDETILMALSMIDDRHLQTVTVVADTTYAESELQRETFYPDLQKP